MVFSMFTGCTEDDSMTEIQRPNQQPETVETDPVVKALAAIPGISDIKIEYGNTYDAIEIKEGDKPKLDSVYVFFFEQPIDHYHPEIGTYRQQAQLNFKGFDRDVVVYTHGYKMGDKYLEKTHLTRCLEANELRIEHRYFGNSQPENVENMSYTYLNADQQAHDIHALVSTLKANLFKTGKFVSTGTSKCGITTALQAYYSDLNNWKDFDCYVPFCAPFMPGSIDLDGRFTCEDKQTGTYLINTCGNGYPEGSVEAVAHERIQKIPRLICTNAIVRKAAIDTFAIAWRLSPSRSKKSCGSIRQVTIKFPGVAPRKPASPKPVMRSCWASRMPAGTSTVTRCRSGTRPWPSHSGQGFWMLLPAPPQFEQVDVVRISPKNVLCTV